MEGTAKVLGQELTVNANLEESGGDRLAKVEERVEVLEANARDLTRTINQLLATTDAPGGTHD